MKHNSVHRMQYYAKIEVRIRVVAEVPIPIPKAGTSGDFWHRNFRFRIF